MSSRSFRRSLGKAAAATVIAGGMALVLSGCDADKAQSGESGASDSKLQVVTAFYPLTYVAEQIGGDKVHIVDLTPSGGHAHDLELSPRQAQALGSADVVLYLGEGFQPSVEQAVQLQTANGIDARQAVPADELREADPHLWLDPLLLADVGEKVAAEFENLEPRVKSYFEDNAAAFEKKMKDLDGQYRKDLAGCEGATLVTSHAAFGYLADAYGLKQEGITGIDPEAEPSPKRLRDVQKVVEDNDVKTLFFESTSGSSAEQKLADVLNVKISALNTLEGVPADGKDYLQVMEDNLSALKDGLNCKP